MANQDRPPSIRSSSTTPSCQEILHQLDRILITLIQWLVSAALALSSATDIWITLCIFVLLQKHRGLSLRCFRPSSLRQLRLRLTQSWCSTHHLAELFVFNAFETGSLTGFVLGQIFIQFMGLIDGV